jgi:hypothetical protein
LGCVARSVVKKGKVVRIYIVKPGENYPSDDGEELLTVGRVEVIVGGSGYAPGIVYDEFGGEYQLGVDSDTGQIVEILPINIVQVPRPPTIIIPEYFPPLPPGGRVERDDNGGFVAIDINGNSIGPVLKGVGALVKPILIQLPTSEDLLTGIIPADLADRVSQEEIQQIIDCVEN